MTPLQKILLLILIVVVWLGCILLDIEFSFGSTGFFNVVLLMFALGNTFLIVGIVARLSGHTWRTTALGLAIIGFCASEMFATMLVVGYQSCKTREITETVFSALKEYHEVNGTYPESLQDLVPDYLPSIPNTAMGWGRRSYQYWKTAHTEFTMSYDCPFFTLHVLKPDPETWFCSGWELSNQNN